MKKLLFVMLMCIGYCSAIGPKKPDQFVMKALITMTLALFMLVGCVKEDEPKPTKKGARWGIIYRDTTNVDSTLNMQYGYVYENSIAR